MAAEDSSTSQHGVSPLNSLFHSLDKQIDSEEVENLKQLLLNNQVLRRDSEKLKSGFNLFHYLYVHGHIREDSLGLLEQIFDNIQRPDLVKEVTKFLNEENSKEAEEAEEAGVVCRDILIDHYKQKTKNVDVIPWYEGIFQFSDLIDVYTRLESHERSRLGKTTENTSILEILDKCNNSQRISIEGEPGIGKSTFCRKLASDWANQSDPILKKYDLFILLELRQMVNESIIDAIFDQLLPVHFGKFKIALEEYISRNQEKILFVLDGADELMSTQAGDKLHAEKIMSVLDAASELKSSPKEGMSKVVKRKRYPKSSVIFSCRSCHCSELVKSADKHFTIKGFSSENVQHYVTKFFEDLEVTSDPGDFIDALNSDENIGILAQNPLSILLLCVLWETMEGKLPSKLCNLYEEIIVSIINGYRKKNNMPGSIDDITGEYRAPLMNLGKIAYDALKENRVRFSKCDLEKSKISESDEVLCYGLLNEEISTAKLRRNRFWVFVHKTFQEYLAAFYLYKSREINTNSAILNSVVTNEELRTVCIFVAGMLGKDAAPLFDAIGKVLDSEAHLDQRFLHYTTLSLECLHESGGHDILAGRIADKIIQNKTISFTNDPPITLSRSCQEGLTALIRHCNTRDVSETNKKLVTLDMGPNSVTLNNTLFGVLSASKDLENLQMSVYSQHKDPVPNFVSVPAKQFQLAIYFGYIETDFLLDLTKSTKLKQLILAVYDTYQYQNFNNYKDQNAKSTSIHLNEGLEYLGFNGQHRAEEVFCHQMGEQIAHHGSLKCLYSTFASNGKLEERRRVMAKILKTNQCLSVWHINTDVYNNGNSTDSRRVSSVGDYVFEHEIALDKVYAGNREFYGALKENRSLKCLIIDHWGDDDDLISICYSIRENKTLHHLLIFLGKVTPGTETVILDSVKQNRSIGLFGIVSQSQVACGLEGYQRIELEPNPDFRYPSGITEAEDKMLYLLRNLYEDISSLNNGNMKFNADVTDKLVRDTLPAFVGAGQQVAAWKRKACL